MGNQNGASAAVLNNAQIANRMKSIFETSLKLHLTGQYMQVIISSKHLVRCNGEYCNAEVSFQKKCLKLEKALV